MVDASGVDDEVLGGGAFGDGAGYDESVQFFETVDAFEAQAEGAGVFANDLKGEARVLDDFRIGATGVPGSGAFVARDAFAGFEGVIGEDKEGVLFGKGLHRSGDASGHGDVAAGSDGFAGFDDGERFGGFGIDEEAFELRTGALRRIGRRVFSASAEGEYEGGDGEGSKDGFHDGMGVS